MTTKRKIIFTAGAKGGSGKTTALVSLADFLHANNIPVTLIDSDVENTVRGSLANVFKETPKVDIRTHRGLDEFVDRVLADTIPLVVADLGAGSGKDTFTWFDDMYEPLKDSGIAFLAVGLVTSEAATVDTVLTWAKTLKTRVNYLIIRNHRNGSDFRYFEKSDAGQQFMKLAKPTIIDMALRAPDIQEELGNRGISLRQAIEAPADVAGPILSVFTAKARMRGYQMRMDEQFSKIIDTLLP